MNYKKLQIIFAILVFGLSNRQIFAPDLIGYLANWGKWENSSFNQVRNVLNQVDHINYSFLEPYSDGRVVSVDPESDFQDGLIKSTIATGKPTSLVFGGWLVKNNQQRPIQFVGDNSKATGYPQYYPANVFSEVAANKDAREKFIDEAVSFASKNGFKGIEIDWEYPGFPAMQKGNDADFANFLELMKSLYPKAKKSGLSVSIAGPAAYGLILPKINLSELSKYVDWIGIMTYDYKGYNWSNKTGHHSSLKPSEGDEGYSAEAVVNYYLSKGVPSNKLILGIALYGRGFGGAQKGSNGLQQEFDKNKQILSGNSKDPGLILWEEILKLPKENIFWDEKARVPYYFGTFTNVKGEKHENTFISFENNRSLCEKGKFIRDKGLKGAMIWDLRPGQEAAIQALKDGMNGGDCSKYIEKTKDEKIKKNRNLKIV